MSEFSKSIIKYQPTVILLYFGCDDKIYKVTCYTDGGGGGEGGNLYGVCVSWGCGGWMGRSGLVGG